MTLGRPIVVVTPNISEQMGGEAIKAHQFLDHLVCGGETVLVITHRRSATVMANDFPGIETIIVEDTFDQIAVWNSVALRPIIASLFFYYSRRHVKGILARHPNAVFHYLCPVSPILPRFPVREATNILGPLTGNIYYPPSLRHGEPIKFKLARSLHFVVQQLFGRVFGNRGRFHRVLVSGGERTRRSLEWAGFAPGLMRDVVDAGIAGGFGVHPIPQQEGVNARFLTIGRLVHDKGFQLTIEALRHVTERITLDVYGDGVYAPHLKRVANDLGVSEKINFKGWTDHASILKDISQYRGFVLPSLAEANGIAVQEMMMAGVPVICLDWGGPTMLTDEHSAVLIEPSSREAVVRRIAAALDALATDPARANDLARRARAIAERRFTWGDVAAQWLDAYELDAGDPPEPAIAADRHRGAPIGNPIPQSGARREGSRDAPVRR